MPSRFACVCLCCREASTSNHGDPEQRGGVSPGGPLAREEGIGKGKGAEWRERRFGRKRDERIYYAGSPPRPPSQVCEKSPELKKKRGRTPRARPGRLGVFATEGLSPRSSHATKDHRARAVGGPTKLQSFYKYLESSPLASCARLARLVGETPPGRRARRSLREFKEASQQTRKLV